MMKRDECFRALARHVTDEIVVATYSSAVDWLDLGERTLNYFSVGAMGLDLLARARAGARPAGQARHLPAGRRQPADEPRLPGHDRRGRAEEPRPHRLPERHLRGQRRASRSRTPRSTSPAWRARPAMRTCTSSRSSASFEQQAAHVLKQDGPVFATLHVEPSKPLTYDYPRLYDPARRKALKAELQRRNREHGLGRTMVCA